MVSTESPSMDPLELVHLAKLMDRTSGRADIRICLIDGPVLRLHPDLSTQNIQEMPGTLRSSCRRSGSSACIHGTFVAGILAGKRGSRAPAIAPGCKLLVRSVFAEDGAEGPDMPNTTADELATAILDAVNARAHLINLSVAIVPGSAQGQPRLSEALNHAARRGVIVVAAAGNQGAVGGSPITSHPWVIPVVACDFGGRPMGLSNLGNSAGMRGLRAPGESITSIATSGEPKEFSGTSAAAPFVTGAVALLWSEFPDAHAAELKLAIAGRGRRLRSGLVPPLLDAWAAYQEMALVRARKSAS